MVVTMFEVWAISAVVRLAYLIWERKQRADLERRVEQLESVVKEMLMRKVVGASDAVLASTQKMADSVTKMMEDIQKDMGDEFDGPSMN